MATIMRVGGGGGKAGIDLTVVSGTTQPTSPKNNTIWVKTETAIGTAYLSPTAPGSPAVGDVWINTTNRYQSDASAVASSTHLLTVAEDPYLTVNVLQFKQWDGSAWNWCDGGIYANNAWTDMALYIFWYGTENESYPIVCMSAAKATTEATIFEADRGSNYIHLPSTNYRYLTTDHNASIDVSNFTTLGIKYDSTSSVSNQNHIGFTSDLSGNPSYNNVFSAQGNGIPGGRNTGLEVQVPITCTGLVRPVIRNHHGSSASSTLTVYYWVLT